VIKTVVLFDICLETVIIFFRIH